MPKKTIAQFTPQQRNANKHSQRGMGMLDNAIAQDGWISAITVAADGETIDGSARLETAYTRFGEDVEPIVVKSKGDRPIIHVREDIPSAEDPKAVRLSVAANRVAEVNLSWDDEVLAEMGEEVDLSGLFNEDEWNSAIASSDSDDDEPLDFGDREPMDGERYPLAIVLSWAEMQEWKAIKEAYKMKSDKEAFLKLMRG